MNMLKRIPLFKGLSGEEISDHEKNMRAKKVGAKTVLFLEGDAADVIYFIVDGAVRIYKSTINGKEITLALFFKGDFFGEMGLIEGRRTANAETLEPSMFYIMEKERFLSILKQHGDVSFKLLMEVAQRLNSTNQRMEHMISDDMKTRILDTIKQYEGVRLTHQEIANMVGTSRESVSRALYKRGKDYLFSQEIHS